MLPWVSDSERKKDQARIDRMLDALEAEMGLKDGEERASMDILVAGIRAATPLLERRAALLGLDAAPGESDAKPTDSPIKRILAAVPKAQ